MKSYHDKVIVITGASSGIGRATALEFARNGASVVLAARCKEALESLAEECNRIGGRALAVQTDVCKEDDVKRLTEKAIGEMGQVNVWVNNAAVTLMGPFEETPIEDIRKVIDTNVMGYIHGAHAILPYFREQGVSHFGSLSNKVTVRINSAHRQGECPWGENLDSLDEIVFIHTLKCTDYQNHLCRR